MKITAHIKPAARENRLEQVDATTYQVAVTEPPVGGRANRAVIKLLADHFDISPSAVRIVRGHTSRTKLIEINA